MCQADDGIENTEHLLLLCKSYIRNLPATLLNNVSDIMELNFELLPNKMKVKILIYGCDTLSRTSNNKVINETIKLIKKSGRFEK